MVYLVESGFADLIADFHLCQVSDVRFPVNIKNRPETLQLAPLVTKVNGVEYRNTFQKRITFKTHLFPDSITIIAHRFVMIYNKHYVSVLDDKFPSLLKPCG